MNTRRELVVSVAAVAELSVSTCSTTLEESRRMEASVTADSVVRFLNHFEEVAMQEDFRLLKEMIDE